MKDYFKESSDLEVSLNRQVELVNHVQNLHRTIYICNTNRNNVNMQRNVFLHSIETLTMAIEVLLEDVKTLEREVRKGTINP